MYFATKLLSKVKNLVTLNHYFTLEMKKTFFYILCLLSVTSLWGQESTSGYNTMKLPSSAHVAALGGENISIIDDDAAIAWHNPALLSNVSHNVIGLSFMTYFAESKWMGAQYVRAFGERHTGSITAQYMDFGSANETDAQGNILGTFSAKDIYIAPSYSYLFNDKWTGGATLKFAFSNYADYSASTIAVDLGLNYYDEETDLSVSATLKNIGSELSSFHDQEQTLPFIAQLGLSKGLAHLPIRISVTLTDLTRWSSEYYFADDEKDKKLSFSKKLLNHIVIGGDYFITDNICISAGYNFRRSYDLKTAGSAHGAGLTAGASLQLKRFMISGAYAKYHKSTSSLMFNVNYTL